jgi:hypothetical protein
MRVVVAIPLLFVMASAFAQETTIAERAKHIKQEVRKHGYRLLDEGGLFTSVDEFIEYNTHDYRKSHEYYVVALVEDCDKCLVRARVFTPIEAAAGAVSTRETEMFYLEDESVGIARFSFFRAVDTRATVQVYVDDKRLHYVYTMLFRKRR